VLLLLLPGSVRCQTESTTTTCVVEVVDGEVLQNYCSIVSSIDGVPELTTFSSAVEENGVTLDPDADYAVFAPTNDAVDTCSCEYGYEYLSTTRDPDSGDFLKRTKRGGGSDHRVSPDVALSFVDRAGGLPNLGVEAATLRTNLTDPQYVNLGHGVPVNIVSEPDYASSYKGIILTTGLGRRAHVQLENPTKFDNGVIYKTDE